MYHWSNVHNSLFSYKVIIKVFIGPYGRYKKKKILLYFVTDIAKRITKQSNRRQEKLSNPSTQKSKEFQGMQWEPTHALHSTIAKVLRHCLIRNFFSNILINKIKMCYIIDDILYLMLLALGTLPRGHTISK